eukprot:GHVL01016561.1.p1 GENE.GHVL01016561.1~~GHVL01016561.1.p1  ORF type:complete len:895 (+),score=142.81 GHVL01016561.1:40-2724(+)
MLIFRFSNSKFVRNVTSFADSINSNITIGEIFKIYEDFLTHVPVKEMRATQKVQGKWKCKITWDVPGEQIGTFGFGPSKTAAEASAILDFMKKSTKYSWGISDQTQTSISASKSAEELVARTKIESVDECVKTCLRALRETPPATWSNFLPEIWRHAVGHGGTAPQAALNIINSLKQEHCGSLSPILWGQMVEDCANICDYEFAKNLVNELHDLDLQKSDFVSEHAKSIYRRGLVGLTLEKIAVFASEMTHFHYTCEYKSFADIDRVESERGHLRMIKVTTTRKPEDEMAFNELCSESNDLAVIIKEKKNEKFKNILNEDISIDYGCDENIKGGVIGIIKFHESDLDTVSFDIELQGYDAYHTHQFLTNEKLVMYPILRASNVAVTRMKEALLVLCLAPRLKTAINPTFETYFSPEIRQILLSPTDAQLTALGHLGGTSIEALSVSERLTAVNIELERYIERLQNSPSVAGSLKEICDSLMLPNDKLRALMSALYQRLTLIQGPPGTGKTYLACAIIRSWLWEMNTRGKKEKILAVTDSNVGADNIMNGLRKAGIECHRFGVTNAKESRIIHHRKYTKYQYLLSHGELQRAKKLLHEIRQEILNDAPVIVTTCISSGLLQNLTCRRVLVDECAQSIEFSTLVALGNGCEKLVLIGDPQQLPPTIISLQARKLGLAESLLERLINTGAFTVHFMNTQRRMHSTISEFPNKKFYSGKLEDGSSDELLPAVTPFPWPNNDSRVCLIHLKTPEGIFGMSRINRGHVKPIISIVTQVLREGSVLPSGIGVVTPYKGQQQLIKAEFARFASFLNIRVDTVDGFQGMERDLLILSTVRSNQEKTIGFLKDPRRMNVALTRAKRGLIVLADVETLKSDPLWAEWVEWVESKESIIDIDDLII